MESQHEVEQVLANWIARSTEGQLAEDVDPAQWIANNFLNWWRNDIEEDLTAAEAALVAVRIQLNELGGFANPDLGEALHELTHASEALDSLRMKLGLQSPSA